jgi:perosamine synthetase
MFVTNDDILYEKVLTLSSHGRSRTQTKQFWPDMVGFKYKMSNLQAAIGCAQMERIDDLINHKRMIFQYYADKLLKMPGISMNPEKPNTTNGYWMPTVVFAQETGVTREKLQKAFAAENIDARVFFWSLSSLGLFSDKPSNQWSYDLPGRSMNLPSYHELELHEQDRVIAVIKNLLTSLHGNMMI